jgi:hypothetical protein
LNFIMLFLVSALDYGISTWLTNCFLLLKQV